MRLVFVFEVDADDSTLAVNLAGAAIMSLHETHPGLSVVQSIVCIDGTADAVLAATRSSSAG